MQHRKKLSFISGVFSSLIFAPLFLLPNLIFTSVLCRHIYNSHTKKEAFFISLIFAFGFHLGTVYWVCLALRVYLEQFWWLIPVALLGLPALLATFYATLLIFCWYFRTHYLFHFFFTLSWLLAEFGTYYFCSGFPWSLLGYALAFNELLMQPASIFSVLGLSYLSIYLGSSFYSTKRLYIRLSIALLLIIPLIFYSYTSLEKNQTNFSSLKIRLVQPVIAQNAKWDPETFWQNLIKQINLSTQNSSEKDPAKLIIWSEAALTMPYYYESINTLLKNVFTHKDQLLLTGGFNDNRANNNHLPAEKYEIYSSLIGLDSNARLLFAYNKAHLVPFGEYVPFANYLPLKKITPGLINYTAGERQLLYLKDYHLYIKPLICYEAIFPAEVRISNQQADLMINITNDAWYGNSSGPYQHFAISRMRAVENGLPLVRAANNGISAIIDPVGRVVKKLDLNIAFYVDGYVPLKLSKPTIFSLYNYYPLILLLIATFCLELFCQYLTKMKKMLVKNTSLSMF